MPSFPPSFTSGGTGSSTASPVAVAYAASLTLDCTAGSTFKLGALTGNLTLNLSGGTDGQKILVRIPQDATGNRLLTLGTSIKASSDIGTVALSTAANAVDYLGFVYDGTSGKYNLVSYNRGF